MQNGLTYIWTNRHLPGMAGTPHVCQWWAANHVGLECPFQWSSLIQTFFNFRLCRWPFIRVAPKAWIRMWNIYVTSIVINAWCWSHPDTLVHGPSHLYPGQHWMPPHPPSTQVAFRLGRSVSNPITLQYLQHNYHMVKDASFVLALGYFDDARKHVLGGTGGSVAMAQILGKPLCLWFGYGTVILVESHFTRLSTLWGYDRAIGVPSRVTG